MGAAAVRPSLAVAALAAMGLPSFMLACAHAPSSSAPPPSTILDTEMPRMVSAFYGLDTAGGLRVAFAVVTVCYALSFLWFLRGWKRHANPVDRASARPDVASGS